MKNPQMHLRATQYLEIAPVEWKRVEPLEKGLRLHYAKDFAIDFMDLYNMQGQTFIPILYLGKEDETEYQEQIAIQVYPERIEKALDIESEVSVFFDINEIEKLNALFAEKKYIPHDIKIYYQGKHVGPEALPEVYHDVFLTYAHRFNMEYCVPLEANRDIFETIHAGYAIKERKQHPLSKDQLYTVPLRKSQIQKGAALGGITIMVMTLLVTFGNQVLKAPDWRLKAVGALVVGIGSLGGIFARQQVAIVAEHAFSNPLLTEKGDIFYE